MRSATQSDLKGNYLLPSQPITTPHLEPVGGGREGAQHPHFLVHVLFDRTGLMVMSTFLIFLVLTLL